MKTSIIVPVYNEEKTVGIVLQKLLKLPINKEIIVIDDGSTDKTESILKQFTSKPDIKIFRKAKNEGKGSAIRTGILIATGDIITIQDADLEYKPEEIIHLIQPITDGKADVVYGSRFLNNKKVTGFFHRLINAFFTFLTNILYRSRLTDMETCYKVFRSSIIKQINLKSKHFEVEAEITVKILKKGFKINEIPVSYQRRTYHQGKKIGWKDGLRTLWILFKLYI